MNSGFQDTDVVVTGGTGHLGRAVVAALLEAGARCHVPCFDPAELEDLPWKGAARAVVTESVDLTDEQEVAGFYRKLPGLWASIHCAGGFGMSPLRETESKQLQHLWRMNFLTCFLCCREALATWERLGAGEGRIVNVAARPALEPRQGAGMVAYTAAKSAVAALTISLAEEVATAGIQVNAVAPSVIDTPPNREAMPGEDWSRWPAPEEIASTILFLASPENRSTRGSIVTCYGQA